MVKQCILPLSLLLSLGAIAGAESPEMDAGGEVERGRYLANDVAKCVECHSPHDAAGNLIQTKLFQGQAIPFESPFRGSKWAVRAPALKGLAGWAEEDMVLLLTTGRRENGKRPLSPMPQFRLSTQDAKAIVAYLKSL